MSQLDTLNALDAELHAALQDAGLADQGHYTAPTANFDVPVRIYLDRDARRLGELGQVLGRHVVMGLLLADVTPTVGGRVYVPADEAIYQLVKPADDGVLDDGSMSRWVVRRV